MTALWGGEDDDGTSKNKRRLNNNDNDDNIDMDSVYDFYRHTLGPALLSSLPLLAHKLASDTWQKVTSLATNNNIVPSSDLAAALAARVNSTCASILAATTATVPKRDMKNLQSVKDLVATLEQQLQQLMLLSSSSTTTTAWWNSLLEWKVGVWLWHQTVPIWIGSLLTVIAVLTIVPGRLHAWSGRLLRWPILGVTYMLVSIELAIYVVIRLAIRLAEYLVSRPRHRSLRRCMAKATSYDEWYTHAQALDRSQGRDAWIRHVDDQTSYVYNWTIVKELLHDLKMSRINNDALQALAVIQQCTRKNVGGIMSEDLFSYTNTGEPKQMVREFIHQVVATLHWLTDQALLVADDENQDDHQDDGSNNNKQAAANQQVQKKIHEERDKLWKSLVNFLDPNHHHHHHDDDNNNSDNTKNTNTTDSPSRVYKTQVLEFLRRARASYGRTALCLSGGSMMGVYHFGHVRSLLETGCLPHIISGTSAGSIIAAILCTRKDHELDRDMQPHVLVEKLICFRRPWSQRIMSLIKTGSMFDVQEWLDLLEWFCMGQSMTFAEAYQRTGRVFCITLSSTSQKAPPVLINYLSAPDVTIASAVVASAAVPGFIPPVRLRVKDPQTGQVRFQGTADETYYDGSIKQDIPTNGLAEMLNCQFFIAAQCNPHINPFFFNSKGGVGRPCRWSSGEQEDSWRGGFLLAALELYLKNDMKAKMVFLRDLNAAVGFTSELLTQDFMGSTTIVPQTTFSDYLRLFDNPTLEQLERCFQAGTVAAYEHTVMIRMHHSIADALEECISRLDPEKAPVRRRRSTLGPRSSVANNNNNNSTQSPPSSIHLNNNNSTDDSSSSDAQTTSPSTNASADTTVYGSDKDEFETNWVDIQ